MSPKFVSLFRLLSSMYVRIAATGLPRFSNIKCPRMLSVSDSAGPDNDWLINAVAPGAFTTVERGRHPGLVISELNGWPTLPLSTVHVRSHDRPRKTRGHDGSAHPFMQGTFTLCSMPVYPGAFSTLPMFGPTPGR